MTADLSHNSADVDRLRLVLLRLTRRIRANTPGNITPSQRSALGTVYVHSPLTVGQLAEFEHVQPPSASKIVTVLEELGMVTRTADPTDRRSTLVAITPAGRATIDEMRAASLGFLSARLAELDEPELRTLSKALPVLEHLLGSADGYEPEPSTSRTGQTS